MAKKVRASEEAKNQAQTTTSKEELIASINTMGKDYEAHVADITKDLKSFNKRSLIRLLKDAIKYPLEENKDLSGDDEVRLASKIRAVQDIKGRMTINYLIIEGQEQKENENGTEKS